MTALLEVTNRNTRFDTPKARSRRQRPVPSRLRRRNRRRGGNPDKARAGVPERDGVWQRMAGATAESRFSGTSYLARARRTQPHRGSRIAMIFRNAMESLNPYLRISADDGSSGDPSRACTRARPQGRQIAMLDRCELTEAKRRSTCIRMNFPAAAPALMDPMALLCRAGPLIAGRATTASTYHPGADSRPIARSQSGKQTAIVMIPRDGRVAGLCDRVLVMYGGRIVE